MGAHDVDSDELAVLSEERSAGVAVVGAARDAVHGDGLAGVDDVALGDDLHAGHVEPVHVLVLGALAEAVEVDFLTVAVLVVVRDLGVLVEFLRGLEAQQGEIGLGALLKTVDVDGRSRILLVVGEVDLEDVGGDVRGGEGALDAVRGGEHPLGRDG